MFQLSTTSIVVLSCIFSSALSLSNEIFTREWHFTDYHYGQYAVNPRTLGKSNDFVYSTCLNSSNTELNCTIVREYFNPDGFVFSDRCFISIQSKTVNQNSLWIRSSLGKQVIFLHIDVDIKYNDFDDYEADLIHGLMNMSTCEYNENKFHIKRKFGYGLEDLARYQMTLEPQIIQYSDGSYDIFIYDKVHCYGARCKYHVNKEGKMDDKMIPYLPKEFNDNNIIMYRSLSLNRNDFLAVMTYNPTYTEQQEIIETNKLKIFHVTPEKYEEVFNLDNKSDVLAIDDSNDQFSICWVNPEQETTMHCSLFHNYNDQGLQEFFKSTITFFYKIETLRIKNLKNGNVLVLNAGVPKPYEKKKYFLTNMMLKGDLFSDSLEIDNLGEYDYKNINISVDDESNVCLTFSEDQSGLLKLSRKCFPSKLLKI